LPADNFTTRDKVTSFAMKLGGGIDVRVNRKVDIRLVEFDYNPIFTRDFSSLPERPFQSPRKVERRTTL
jgi:hypothetical protein